MCLTRAVLHGSLYVIPNFFVLTTGQVGGMETSKEVFEEVFIRLDLFIRLIILDLMLIWLMVKYLFHLLVKCRKHQVVAKVRATEMALKLVAMSNVILNRYQHGLLVGMENTNNKITQIF